MIGGVEPVGYTGGFRAGHYHSSPFFCQRPELCFDGMVFADIFEGVFVHGAYAFAIYDDIGNFIAFISGDFKGYIMAASHIDSAAGVNGAAFAGSGFDDVAAGRTASAAMTVIVIIAAITHKGYFDGVIFVDITEGIPLHGAYAFTIDNHIVHFIVSVGIEGEGLVIASFYYNVAFGRDFTVAACGGIDGIGNRSGVGINNFAVGPNFHPNPAINDGQIAFPNELIAVRDVGEVVGVDRGGIGRNGQFAFTSLFFIYDIPVVQSYGDIIFGLVCWSNFHPNPAINDGEVAFPNELITVRDVGEVVGVDSAMV